MNIHRGIRHCQFIWQPYIYPHDGRANSGKSVLYCWVCQMIREITYQLSSIYSISGQNRASQLLCHLILLGLCESNVNSETFLFNQISCFRKIQILFREKNTIVLTKGSLKIPSSKCSSLSDVMLGECVLFNKQSAFLWILTVLLFLSTC